MQSTCAFADCPQVALAHGLCAGHNKQRAKGQPLRPLRPYIRGIAERLAHYTDRSGDCWVWTGALRHDGYGRMNMGGRVTVAHRVAFEHANGPIDPDLSVDHMCHNPRCVRVSHLQAVTNSENGENRRGPQANSSSGVRGVRWVEHAQKWSARASSRGTEHHAGYFDTIEEATEAAIAKRLEIHTNNLRDRAAS